MEALNPYISLLSVSILLSAFVLVASKRIISYLRAFRVQSLILTAVAGLYGFYRLISEGLFEGILIIMLLTLILKVFYIPSMLEKLSKKVEYKVEKDFFINIPASILICCCLLILVWFTVSRIPKLAGTSSGAFLTEALTVVIIGLFFMISRKKAIGQITGFLMMENGTFLAAMLLTSGMPLIVEFGVFFDLLSAVLIMGVFVFRINETFEHIDLNKLRKLRG